MATISGLTPSQAYWYACNWNQMIGAILFGGGASSDNLDLKGFRYTNDGKDETTEPYADVTVTGVENRHGLVPGSAFHYTSPYHLPDDVEEVVLCLAFSPGNFGVDTQLTIDDRYGLGFYYLWNYPVAWIKTVYRTTNGTVSTLGADGVHEIVLNYLPDGVNSGITANGLDFMPRDANGYYWASRGEPNKYSKVSFKCSHKLFETQRDAELYLKYGIDKSLNEEGEEGGGDEDEELESGTYFYDCYNEYYSDLALTNHIASTTQKYRITFEDFPKGTTPVYAKVNNEKYINNVQFMVHDGYGEYITSASTKIGNIEVPITENILSTFMGIRTNYGIIYDSSNDRYCKTTVYTNMPIIGVDGNAVPGRVPDSDDMISAENGADYDCGLSECWLLDTENVQKLASIFNTTINKNADDAVTAVVAEWLQGLSCYSNPLDVVCDLFYMPIDVSDFVTGTNRSFKLQPDFFDD